MTKVKGDGNISSRRLFLFHKSTAKPFVFSGSRIFRFKESLRFEYRTLIAV